MASVADPALLLIDELSLGLAPIVVEQLLGFLEQIRAEGTTSSWSSSRSAPRWPSPTRPCFLERGAVAFVGPTADLLDRPDLARSIYLAGAGDASAPDAAPADLCRPRLRHRRRDIASRPATCSVRYGGVSALSDVDLAVRLGRDRRR